MRRPEEIEQYLKNREVLLGLGTGELTALWRQESGGSADPTLKGPALSRGRGNAIGPMQLVPYYHPTIKPDSDIKTQLDYASDFYAKSGANQADRLRKYYGVGVAPAGHPTTGQYVQQVQNRMPRFAALAPPTITDAPQFQPLPQITKETQMTPEEYELERRRMAAPRYSDYVPEPAQPTQPNMFERMMTNPMTQMGAAMMVGSGVDWGRAGGMGLMAANNAVYNRQQAEAELAELQQKRAEARYRAAREQRKSDIEDVSYEELMKLADSYEIRGDRQKAQMIRAGITSGMGPETFTATKTFIGPDGKPLTVMTGNQGSVRPVEGLGMPIAYDPETGRSLSYGKAEGGEAGQQGIKTLTDMHGAASAASSGIKAVKDMRTFLDQGMFTGRGDELARELGGWFSWATGKELPKLSATEQYRMAVQEIVLPSLQALKGSSSDRDVAMIKEYAQGTNMTEAALRGALDRLEAKYGDEIGKFNRAHSTYTEGGKKPIVGFEPVQIPSGYVKRPDDNKKKRTGWSLERGQ